MRIDSIRDVAPLSATAASVCWTGSRQPTMRRYHPDSDVPRAGVAGAMNVPSVRGTGFNGPRNVGAERKGD
jgi:hypothetical protein